MREVVASSAATSLVNRSSLVTLNGLLPCLVVSRHDMSCLAVMPHHGKWKRQRIKTLRTNQAELERGGVVTWRRGEGKGREGKGREGKGREGKGREGKGREGRKKQRLALQVSTARQASLWSSSESVTTW